MPETLLPLGLELDVYDWKAIDEDVGLAEGAPDELAECAGQGLAGQRVWCLDDEDAEVAVEGEGDISGNLGAIDPAGGAG